MSLPNGATKRPVNDLTSFDVSKHSPEQIARLFARWKEQCRRVERRKDAAPIRVRSLRIMPRLRPHSATAEVRASDAVDARQSPSRPPDYSADFAALLDNGGDSAAAQRIKSLRFRSSEAASRPGIARSRLRWALAGAASVIAVTAVAGTVHWPYGSNLHQQATASTAAPAQAELPIEPAPEPQMALPLLPAVTGWAGPEPLLQRQLADLARWPAAAATTKAPLLAMLKPDTIQTASSDADAAALATGTESAAQSGRASVESVQEIATATGDTTTRGTDVEEEAAAPTRATSISSGLDPHDDDRVEMADDSGMSVAGLQPDQAAPGGGNGGSAGGESGGKSGAGERGGGGDSGRGASGGGDSGSGGAAGPGGDSGGGESGGGGTGGSEGGAGDGGESGGDGDSDGGDPEGGESDGESGENGSGGGLRGAVGGLLGGARDVIGGARDVVGGIGKALGGKDNGADGGKDQGGGKRGGNG